MKYTCVIVDDTPQEITDLYHVLISYFPEVEILKVCSDIQVAISVIQNEQPHIVFMNIELANQSDVFHIRDLTKNIYLIFTASEIEYSVKAFALNAFDFLMTLRHHINLTLDAPYRTEHIPTAQLPQNLKYA